MIEHTQLIGRAKDVRAQAYAPYSKFKVGAAILAENGEVYMGCNVENAAYPQGTCAEAGAIAQMIAQGGRRIVQIAIIADCPEPLTPCGGCRQKIIEFSSPDTRVIMATTSGRVSDSSIQDLLPGAFTQTALESPELDKP